MNSSQIDKNFLLAYLNTSKKPIFIMLNNQNLQIDKLQVFEYIHKYENLAINETHEKITLKPSK